MKKLFKRFSCYIISIGLSLAISILSALVTMGKMNVMQSLNQPPLSPPAQAFPFVWSVLYVLMGISAAIIYKRRYDNPDAATKGLVIYGISLLVNFFWSIIFFNFGKYLFAFFWLILLLFLIMGTLYQYKKISKPAAYLQIPYVIWVTFAGYLTFGIWLLNR